MGETPQPVSSKEAIAKYFEHHDDEEWYEINYQILDVGQNADGMPIGGAPEKDVIDLSPLEVEVIDIALGMARFGELEKQMGAPLGAVIDAVHEARVKLAS